MDRSASAQSLLRACALSVPHGRALLAHALRVPRERLIARPETRVDEDTQASFARLVGAHRAGMPMAYLLGEQEFYGHRMRVTPDVLIPRPDSELLVQSALEALHGRAQAQVLDLGTGSGCIAIALALERTDLKVVASDRSVAALRVAQDNCRRLGASVHLVAGDWYEPFQGRFDLIVSNPPYIPGADPHLAQLGFEPRIALTDEGDGLSALRTIIAGAQRRLAPGGQLLVEHGYDQGAAVCALMREHGLARIRTLQDLAGHERACLAQGAR